MFHYRLKPLNNRARLLFAVFWAVALHIGLINFKFTLKPVLVPNVTLSRSVSVFLNQRNTIEKPVSRTEKTQTAETEAIRPVPQKPSAINEKKAEEPPQPVLAEKNIRQPVVEKIVPAALGPEKNEKDVIPEVGEAAGAQKSVRQQEPQTSAEEHGGKTFPGTLQMAYPRYQLNNPPAYPGLARKRGQEGTVILQVLVSKEGRVTDLKIDTSSGFRLLDRAAAKAVQKWLFVAGQQDEESVEMWVKVPVTFQLK